MVEPGLIGLIIFYFFTCAIFARLLHKSVAKQLGAAATKYRDTGIKVRIQKDD